MEPVMEFEGYSINKLFYGTIESDIEIDESEDEDDNFERKVSIGISEDKKKGIVILNVILFNSDNQKSIDVEVAGEFSINKSLEIEEVEELLTVNGVALIYPYVRSIISMITSLDSSSAIIIPTLNTKIFSNKEEE